MGMQENLIEYMERLENLEEDFYKYKKNTGIIIDSHHEFFQNLFLYYELTPRKILKNRRALYDEMLMFVNNLCEKYELEYWLNYGTLLGAFRHGGFIPWDDDVDISMMRKDFDKFLAIFQDEISMNNLTNCLNINYGYKVSENTMVTFPSIQCIIPKNIKNIPLSNIAFIDLFPYDYVKSLEVCTDKKYNEVRRYFNINALKQYNDSYKFDRNELMNKVYDKLGLTLEKTDIIIPGVEGIHSFGGKFEFMSFEEKSIFPLKKVPFEKNLLQCPYNEKKILKQLYGEGYINIPKIIENHNALNNFERFGNIDEIIQMQTNKIKLANDSFDL